MTKVDNKTFDMVHGTQQIYRKLLDCMARPGKTQSISDSIHMIEPVHGFSPGLLAIAYTLVDREASFHVISNQRDEVSQYLHWKTFSHLEKVEQAPYIFIQEQLDDQEIHELMTKVNHGTLEDPHSSATLIINIKSFNSGIKMKLTGPGIDGNKECYVAGLSPKWFAEREFTNKEYPLGVDLILVAESEEVMAIPRTTLIESECS
ncbi:phosphonate C-P lyase system protein PhnH [Metabacillus herbersteinensis]|uniref:Phosphonate C-P lyase system protein PhnH n=1 Tax=Metabacillus herbersteinensis TaxID=283816 RepID=A0ABV6GC38_9BACI